MASGYMTSDGKDLDARYLGINSKAVSAGYADSAGSATSAGKLSQRAFVYRNGAAITGTVPGNKTGRYYTVPVSGLLVYTSVGPVRVNNSEDDFVVRLTLEGDSETFYLFMGFVQADDKLQYISLNEHVTVPITIIPFYVQ